jgi:hypothetical protein
LRIELKNGGEVHGGKNDGSSVIKINDTEKSTQE